MVKGPVHDHYCRLLDRLITAVAGVLEIAHRGQGGTTWIRPEVERGLESDQCYVFDPAKLATVDELPARGENNVPGYPNLDLAVEVDISRPQADRPAIYASLEVPVVWTFDTERVTIAQISSSQSDLKGRCSKSDPTGSANKYVDIGRSRWIPVKAEDATRWLVPEDTRDMFAWEQRVRAWAELLPRLPKGV
jgi:hypothetical protein